MPRVRPLAPVLAAAIALGALVVEPAAARSPAACVNMAHQLVHYDTMRARAAESGNALWTRRLDAQISVVEEQLAERCPEEARNVRTSQQIAQLLKLAAQGALTFLTFGAY